jgi:hypothetical protein
MAAILMYAGTATAQEPDKKYFNNLDGKGVILDGYDPVAFY